jgi:hypothetical protein
MKIFLLYFVDADEFFNALKCAPELDFILSGNAITPEILRKIVQKPGETMRL